MTDTTSPGFLSLSSDAIYQLLLDVSGQRPELVRQALSPVEQPDGRQSGPVSVGALVDRVVQARTEPLLLATLPAGVQVERLSFSSNELLVPPATLAALEQRATPTPAVNAPASPPADAAAPDRPLDIFDSSGVREGLLERARQVRDWATPHELSQLGMVVSMAWMEAGVPHRTPVANAYDLGKAVLDTLLESDVVKTMPTAMDDGPGFSAFFKGMKRDISPMGHEGLRLMDRLIDHALVVRSGVTAPAPSSVPVPARGALRFKSTPSEDVPVVTQLYGPAPTDAAFQALSDRLVALAQQQPEAGAPDAAVTMGNALGEAMASNELSSVGMLHLLQRMVDARATVEPMSSDAKGTFLRHVARASGDAFTPRLRNSMVNRLSGMDEMPPSVRRPPAPR